MLTSVSAAKAEESRSCGAFSAPFRRLHRDVLPGSSHEISKVDLERKAACSSSVTEKMREAAETVMFMLVRLLVECPEAIDCKRNGAGTRRTQTDHLLVDVAKRSGHEVDDVLLGAPSAVSGLDHNCERLFALVGISWVGELAGRPEQSVDDDVTRVPALCLVIGDDVRGEMAYGRVGREHTQARYASDFHGSDVPRVVREMLTTLIKHPGENEGGVVGHSFEGRVQSGMVSRKVQNRIDCFLLPHGKIPFHGKLATKWRSIWIVTLERPPCFTFWKRTADAGLILVRWSRRRWRSRTYSSGIRCRNPDGRDAHRTCDWWPWRGDDWHTLIPFFVFFA